MGGVSVRVHKEFAGTEQVVNKVEAAKELRLKRGYYGEMFRDGVVAAQAVGCRYDFQGGVTN